VVAELALPSPSFVLQLEIGMIDADDTLITLTEARRRAADTARAETILRAAGVCRLLPEKADIALAKERAAQFESRRAALLAELLAKPSAANNVNRPAA
jgi:hypothetical protein